MKKFFPILFLIILGSELLLIYYFLAGEFIKIEQKNEPENIFQESKKLPNFLEEFLPFPLEEFKRNLISEKSDFLEIDLVEMKAKIYQKGEKTSEFQVLAKGEYGTWGVVSVGLYKVLSRHKIAFSNAEKVYMPYAINFYGKYYIHGEPYYPDGTPLDYPFSGGCIRFSNDDAKILFESAKEGMPILITDSGFKDDGYRYSLKRIISDFPKISAKSYLVADLDNGFIFSEKNSKEILPIASLTKLMTTIVVQENKDLKSQILATQKMLEPFKSFQWFKPKLEIGRYYRPVELFYPTLISSSNDTAEALSYFLGKAKTLKLMEEKAKSIGMKNTKFFEVTGLGRVIKAEENLSTAQDLFHFAQYLVNIRPLILKITKGEKVTSYGPISFKDLDNKNIFFDREDFFGGKTGYTKTAGYVGLFIFNFLTKEGQNRKVAILLLNSKDLKKDSEEILNWLKINFFQ